MEIRYLILALTTRCNLRCRYCYNGRVPQQADMPQTVIKRAISIAAESNKPFHLQLTGGEPTLVPDLIERAASLARDTGKCHSVGIQTNGTCLTNDLLNVFMKHNIHVGVSLDGPPSIHQQQRGRSSETFRGLKLLEEAKIPFSITTVVTQVNAPVLDRLVLTLSGFSYVRGIGLDLLIRKGRAKDFSVITPADMHTLSKGLRNMLATLDIINARRSFPISLRERELIISAKNSRIPLFCHACRGESMAVRPDGRIFVCGQTLGDERFSAGTVWRPESEGLNALCSSKLASDQCAECPLRGYCPDDCPSRIHYNQAFFPMLTCVLYRTILDALPPKIKFN